ncbi:MAG: aminotransferase class I/II-fold pyridoxal phosphate-dependent enzyme [Pseudomonadota bacterium]
MPNSDQSSAFLAPQERFEAIAAKAFRGFGPRLVDLSYANPYDGPDEVVLDALKGALQENRDLDFQYSPYGGRTVTRRAIASQLSQAYELPFNFRDIIMTPGAMAGLNVAFRSLFEGGGELIVLVPCWLDYPLYLENLSVPFRFVPLASDKHLDFDALLNAIDQNTRGIILSNPGCPSGVILNEGELQRLSALLKEKAKLFGSDIYLIGDEVHKDIIWKDESFCSVLKCHPNSLSIYSFGKSFLLQGQRIGYLAVNPLDPNREVLRESLLRNVRRMGFCTPTGLMQKAVLKLLTHRPALDGIARQQAYLRSELAGMGYDVCDAGGTFFIYAKSPVADDMAFSEFLGEKGVLVLPSSIFHEEGYFRISLTAKKEALETCLPAFAEARKMESGG